TVRIPRFAILLFFLAIPAHAMGNASPPATPPAAAAGAPAPDNAKPVPDMTAQPAAEEKIIDLKTLKSRAAKGDPGAQDMLGNHYEEGDGVKQDSVKAAKWYYRSAQQGYAKAQSDLGVLYLRGDGVPQDYEQA